MPVRIAIIDDNADDRALVAHELKQQLPGTSLHEVCNQKGLDSLVASADFDVVITDFQLGWTDGLQVLHQIKAHAPEVPVIMFTGSGSEEVAVAAMKAGLDDYVIKSARSSVRLLAAIQAALRLREERKQARDAEKRYRELFDTVPVGLFRCTPAGEILDANPAFLQMLGYEEKPGNIAGFTLPKMHLNPAEFTRWRTHLERHGAVASFESQFRHRDGAILWVEIHAKAIRDEQTGSIIYEGSVDDITQRRKAESEREHLIEELQEALVNVKGLSGLLPICSCCKKIRDQEGRWNQLEIYIRDRSNAEFTHSFCPECMTKNYPEFVVDMPKT